MLVAQSRSSLAQVHINEIKSWGEYAFPGSPLSFMYFLGTPITFKNPIWIESYQCIFATSKNVPTQCFIYKITQSLSKKTTINRSEDVKVSQISNYSLYTWHRIASPSLTVTSFGYSFKNERLTVALSHIKPQPAPFIGQTHDYVDYYYYDFDDNIWVLDSNPTKSTTEKKKKKGVNFTSQLKGKNDAVILPQNQVVFKIVQVGQLSQIQFKNRGFKYFDVDSLILNNTVNGINFELFDQHSTIPIYLFHCCSSFGILFHHDVDFKLNTINKIVVKENIINPIQQTNLQHVNITYTIQQMWFNHFDKLIYILFDIKGHPSQPQNHKALYSINLIDLIFDRDNNTFIINDMKMIAFESRYFNTTFALPWNISDIVMTD